MEKFNEQKQILNDRPQDYIHMSKGLLGWMQEHLKNGKRLIAGTLTALSITAIGTMPAKAAEVDSTTIEITTNIPNTVVAYGSYDTALEVPTSSISNENSDNPKLSVTKELKYFSTSEKAKYDEVLDPMEEEYNTILNEINAGTYKPANNSDYNKDLSMTRFSAVLTDFTERYTITINDQKSNMRSNLKSFLTYFTNLLKMAYHDQTDIRLSTFNSFEKKHYCDLLVIDTKYYTISYPKSGSTIDYTKASELTEFPRNYTNGGSLVPGTSGITNVTTDYYGNVTFTFNNTRYTFTSVQYSSFTNYITQIDSYYNNINDNINSGLYNDQVGESLEDGQRRFLGDLNLVNRASWAAFGNCQDATVKGLASNYLTARKNQAINSYATKAQKTVAAVTSADQTYYYLRINDSSMYGYNAYPIAQYGKNYQTGQWDLSAPLKIYSATTYTSYPAFGYVDSVKLPGATTPSTPTPQPQPSQPGTNNGGSTIDPNGNYHDADGNPVDPSEIIPIDQFSAAAVTSSNVYVKTLYR